MMMTAESFKPVVGHRKLNKQGGSYMISIPKEWMEHHGLTGQKQLLVVANKDIRIVHPDSEKDIDLALHELVKKGDYVKRDESLEEKPQEGV